MANNPQISHFSLKLCSFYQIKLFKKNYVDILKKKSKGIIIYKIL